MNNTTLDDLIEWLKKQDLELIVSDGFGPPHSDRGSYEELAFKPHSSACLGDMLKYSESALEATFPGWKGGEYTMHGWTPVYIGEDGECGTPITPIHFKYWLLTGKRKLSDDG